MLFLVFGLWLKFYTGLSDTWCYQNTSDGEYRFWTLIPWQFLIKLETNVAVFGVWT